MASNIKGLCIIPAASFNQTFKLLNGCIKTKTAKRTGRFDYVMFCAEKDNGPVTAFACSAVALVKYQIPSSRAIRPFCCYLQNPRIKPRGTDGPVTVFQDGKKTGISFRAQLYAGKDPDSSLITQCFDEPASVEGVHALMDYRDMYQKLSERVSNNPDAVTTTLNASYFKSLPCLDEVMDPYIRITQINPQSPMKLTQSGSEFFIMPIKTSAATAVNEVK